MVAVNVLQLNLTIQRRSRAHVENSPPPEKLNSNKKSLARNIFILKTTKRKAVPALLRYPKLFARYSLRTILTATPTHTPFIAHRARSCSLLSNREVDHTASFWFSITLDLATAIQYALAPYNFAFCILHFAL